MREKELAELEAWAKEWNEMGHVQARQVLDLIASYRELRDRPAASAEQEWETADELTVQWDAEQSEYLRKRLASVAPDTQGWDIDL